MLDKKLGENPQTRDDLSKMLAWSNRLATN